MSEFKRWIIVAAVIRFIAAYTNLGTWHPDEWFQTVEFGNYLGLGFMSHTQEVVYHLRNLTWPALLAVPLRFADAVWAGDLAARMHAVKLLTAFFDLATLWGYSRLLVREKMSPNWRMAAWVVAVLPAFTVPESVRPSQEHLSAIAFWCAIGFLALELKPKTREFRAAALAAGVVLALTGVFRYPSGLFAVGALAAIAANARLRPKLKWALAGAALGVALGGIADWAVYGRPYESLWMYLQYNVLTGISSRQFGAQSALVYWDFFHGMLARGLAPLGLVALVLAPWGFVRALRAREPWAWGSAAYLAGHLLIAHKESRFMAPLALVMVWAAFQGARAAWEYCGDELRPRSLRVFRAAAVTLFTIAFIGNLAQLARSLWGETWRLNDNYLQLSRLAREYAPCAVVSVRRPLGAQLPWKRDGVVPDPALAYYPAPAHLASSSVIADTPLIWIERAPKCPTGGTVLIQPQKPENFWADSAHCRLAEAGPLRWIPKSVWNGWIVRGWVSAPWYVCPPSALKLFNKQDTQRILAMHIRPIQHLPPFGVSADDFLRLAAMGQPEAVPLDDATFPQWQN